MADRKDDEETVIGTEDHDPSLTHCIAWVDEQIESRHCQKIVVKMKQLCTLIMEFNNLDQCVSRLKSLEKSGYNSRIIFITSGRLSAEVIPKIHDLSIVESILIFCFNLENVQNLRFEKLRKAVTKRLDLLAEIEDIICTSEEAIPFSLHSDPEVQIRTSE